MKIIWMRYVHIFAAELIIVVSGCAQNAVTGSRTDALEGKAWEQSEWISALDAPTVTGIVNSRDNRRAADGASWFLTTIRNPGKVVSAKWMTTALGVYELYQPEPV